jgi:hypothetical protein
MTNRDDPRVLAEEPKHTPYEGLGAELTERADHPLAGWGSGNVREPSDTKK